MKPVTKRKILFYAPFCVMLYFFFCLSLVAFTPRTVSAACDDVCKNQCSVDVMNPCVADCYKNGEGEECVTQCKSKYDECLKNTCGCAASASGNTSWQCLPGAFCGANIKEFIEDVLTIGSPVLGGLAVIKIMFGGVMYATASGNPQRMADAKSHIIYALIGLTVLLSMNTILLLIGAYQP